MNINRGNYLKSIYELGGYKKRITNKEIAEDLGVSAPSVSQMIKKLLNEGYLNYESYKGVTLTDLGVLEARKIRKRHLLWEVFLVKKLGYDWDEVNEEAKKLEHVMSDKMEERLDEYLEYPETCPHGSTLISDNINIKMTRLKDAEVGERKKIVRILDRQEIMRIMDKVNISIGDEVRVVRNDKDGVILDNGKLDVKIPIDLVDKIFID